ncbi:hypothetical protein niasHT_022253 [Heterodera trifolii]|uniref:Uncharacterized protein n=1 Tax=Heterodera trifolii TaxID=157864 RepID=A0ABD2KAX7_9BILA
MNAQAYEFVTNQRMLRGVGRLEKCGRRLSINQRFQQEPFVAIVIDPITDRRWRQIEHWRVSYLPKVVGFSGIAFDFLQALRRPSVCCLCRHSPTSASTCTSWKFFYRDESLKPFSRKYSHIFDHLETTENGQVKEKCAAFLDCYFQRVKIVDFPGLVDHLSAFQRYADRLLFVPFTDVGQYFCTTWKFCAPNALIYLAAAVSDFYKRQQKLPTHKIQSWNLEDGELQLKLSIVPKILKRLVDKMLETDESILIGMARAALEKYRNNEVIGNIMQQRKRHVTFVYPRSEDRAPEDIWLTEEAIDRGKEIEEQIVVKLFHQHAEFCAPCRHPSTPAATMINLINYRYH